MDNLIFDLGYHIGVDSKHYIEKDFNVLAVEANPTLIGSYKHSNLIVINAAIVSQNYTDGKIAFYVNAEHTDWSSCDQNIANQNNSTSTKIFVPVVTIRRLVDTYGVPYYMKVDVEGADLEVAKQVVNLPIKPRYISFELNKRDYAEIFMYLKMSGYKKFQLINQINNEPYSSGTFGEYLDKTKWLSFDEALGRYIKYRELKFIDNTNLAIGWIDIHASME